MKTETVSTNGIEMDYASFGSGKRAFVILPGVSVKSVMPSAIAIRSAYKCFCDTHTVYVFDRRKNMPEPYSVRQMAADTAVVMQALGIRDADIFGASQGGMMAMCLAIDNPELVHKIALGSTSAKADDAVYDLMDRWIGSAQSGDVTALTALMIDDLFSPNTIGRFREALVHMNDDADERDLRRFIIQTQAIHGFDLSGELQQIKCPAFVIGSEGDRVLPVAHSRRIVEKLGCKLYVYGSEYGHCVFDEAPDYKQRLYDFFQDEAL